MKPEGKEEEEKKERGGEEGEEKYECSVSLCSRAFPIVSRNTNSLIFC